MLAEVSRRRRPAGGRPGARRLGIAPSDGGAHAAGAAGFTLLELILVMVLLAVVLGVAAPALAPFFRGRTLDAEAHRFLALTRHGQSRAVAEGVPMVLWIDASRGTYGLEAETSYTDGDLQAQEFQADDGVEIVVEERSVTTTMPWQQSVLIAGQQPMIRFTPDGFIGESSPERIVFQPGRRTDAGALAVARSRNRLNYELQTDIEPPARR